MHTHELVPGGFLRAPGLAAAILGWLPQRLTLQQLGLHPATLHAVTATSVEVRLPLSRCAIPAAGGIRMLPSIASEGIHDSEVTELR